ncbi:MAG: hypothetical protein IIY06_06800 [Proteobacteria bacterium]|nr:hypothetical protein [Pseudomonadota bacterium]
MSKNRFSNWNSKLRNRLMLVLGVTGFSSTVVACYGPPAYIPDELPNHEQEMISRCLDGSVADSVCPNGCIQGQCLEKGGNIGASCNAELYLESCSSNGDKKVICQDGQIQEADCRSCVDLEDHVVCSSDNE